MPPGALTSLRSGNWTSLDGAWAGEQSRGMGRGPSGEKSPAFPRLSTPSFHPTPLLRAESSTGPQEGEGPGAGGGWPRPGGLAFVARWPAVARRLRGGGLTPRCIVQRGPPPVPGVVQAIAACPSASSADLAVRGPGARCRK